MKPAVTDPEIGLFLNAVEGKSIAIFTHDVPAGRDEEFLAWQREVTRAASGCPGYLRTLLFPPNNEHAQWISSLHFETPSQLDAWLESPERQRLLEDKPVPFRGLEMKRGTVGLDEWFATGSGTPGWRMVAAVVLALYPTLVALGLLVNPWLPPMTYSQSLMVGAILGVAVLQWAAMPLVTRCFGWWLGPASKVGAGRSVLGTVAIALLLLAMMLLAGYLSGKG